MGGSWGGEHSSATTVPAPLHGEGLQGLPEPVLHHHSWSSAATGRQSPAVLFVLLGELNVASTHDANFPFKSLFPANPQ